MSEHRGGSYKGKAQKYAGIVDEKPIHIYYARPGLNAVLPELAGKNVLDCGCGSGYHAEYLLQRGASVTAFDLDEEFVELTRSRVGEQALVLQADLAQPFKFASDNEFDLAIAQLVMHYLKDWKPTLRELGRVLKPGAQFAFTTHHPFNDWQLYDLEDYFGHELITDEWDIGTVQFYRRPLTTISADLEATGFVIEKLYEPQPTPEYFVVDAKSAEKLNNRPWFLVIRARNENR